jgi:hypothetical protein
LVASAAVEETVPDVQAARRVGAAVMNAQNFSPNSSTTPPLASASPARAASPLPSA